MKHFSLFLLVSLSACDLRQRIDSEPLPDAPPAPQKAPEAPVPSAAPEPAGPPPVLGDPYGLLSKREEPAPKLKARELEQLDPGALMASGDRQAPQPTELERDPRAVARAAALPRRQQDVPLVSSEISEKSAAEVMRQLRDAGGKARVLFLYASYCKACRSVMPRFVEVVRAYQGQGVSFAAASVDKDRDAFAAYTSALGGVLSATWITPDGTTASELRRMGLPVEGSGYSIPLLAVLNRREQLVAYGYSELVSKLPKTLDALLQ